MKKDQNDMRFIVEICPPGKSPQFVVRPELNRKILSTKQFTHHLLGGRDNALTLAKKHRDREIKKYNIPKRVSPNSPRSRNTRNQSGYMGVNLIKEKNRGYISYAWLGAYKAVIDGESKHFQQKRSLKKYGYEQAFLLALKFRCKGTGEPLPKDPVIPTPDKDVKKWMDLNEIIF